MVLLFTKTNIYNSIQNQKAVQKFSVTCDTNSLELNLKSMPSKSLDSN